VTERARTLAGGALKAPPSGELAANTVSRLRGLAPSQRELANPKDLTERASSLIHTKSTASL